MNSDTLHHRQTKHIPGIYDEPPPPYPGHEVSANTQYNQKCTSTLTQVLTYGSPTVLLKQVLHEDPVQLRCPYCGSDIVTATKYKNGSGTWLASGIMCFIGMYLGCCLLPFCLKGCKDVVHSCPKCKTEIGRYSRLGDL